MKTVEIVNLDKVRIQQLVFISGWAVMLIGVVLAAVAYLGERLEVKTSMAAAPTLPPAFVPPPAPPLTPEEQAEQHAHDDRQMWVVVGIGAAFITLFILAALIFGDSGRSSTITNTATANLSAETANDTMTAADTIDNAADAALSATANIAASRQPKPATEGAPMDQDFVDNPDDPDTPPASSPSSPTDKQGLPGAPKPDPAPID